MPTRFPNVGEDGSFVIRARFAAAPNAGPASARQWLANWVEENADWAFLDHTHCFFDYFTAPPDAELDPSGSLCIILRGISDKSRFWKDWFVRVCRELQAEFPEVGELTVVEDAEGTTP